MMILYHGSFVEVSAPLAKVGRRNLDFGHGFYVTKIEEQARAWAIVIASRKGRNVCPILNTYTFNRAQAEKDGIRFKCFDTYDLEWLDYVVACRRGKDISADYDVVEGGVANDNVIDKYLKHMGSITLLAEEDRL